MKTLLLITRIKPNPLGKDRNRLGRADAVQLAAEWVDFKNIGSVDIALRDVVLYHIAYSAGQGRWERVMGFTGILEAGKTVRVHSGSGPVSVIRMEDWLNADHHVFTNRDNYVWNNAEGDAPMLFDTQVNQQVDHASYDPYPPEGQVLYRSGNKLIAAKASAA